MCSAGDLADHVVAHADLQAHELVLVPALVVVLVADVFGFDEQLGAAQGLGLVAGLDLLEGQQQDVLVPAGADHGQRPGRGGLHDELGAGDKAVAGRVGEHLDGHFAADAVGLADSCHLKLHLFLCSGLVIL